MTRKGYKGKREKLKKKGRLKDDRKADKTSGGKIDEKERKKDRGWGRRSVKVI